jgi:TetR/AcrR family transcriptional regulator, multidrug resistance operon repressor
MRFRDELKQHIIREKALELLVQEGLNGFSMQKLAKAAGVSPATSYIYYKDKEDLILELFVTEMKKMLEATLVNFDPSLPFREGLKVQWINRAKYYMKHPDSMRFMEQIRHSPLQEKAAQRLDKKFSRIMESFVDHAIKRKELIKVPVEVYWSVAFAPLYALVNFHISGQSIGGRPFRFSDRIMLQALDLVLKALHPTGQK